MLDGGYVGWLARSEGGVERGSPGSYRVQSFKVRAIGLVGTFAIVCMKGKGESRVYLVESEAMMVPNSPYVFFAQASTHHGDRKDQSWEEQGSSVLSKCSTAYRRDLIVAWQHTKLCKKSSSALCLRLTTFDVVSLGKVRTSA